MVASPVKVILPVGETKVILATMPAMAPRHVKETRATLQTDRAVTIWPADTTRLISWQVLAVASIPVGEIPKV